LSEPATSLASVPDQGHPLARAGLLARGLPFAAAMLLAPVAVLLPPGVADPTELAIAAGASALILLLAIAVPWQRLPRGAGVVLPLAYLVVVALLRDADGGAASGFAPLVLLPVAWTALHGARWQLAAVVAGAAAALALPIAVFGDPAYPPSSEWRAAGVWVAFAALLGFVVQRIVGEIGSQAAASRRDLDERVRAERRLSVEGDITRILGESATLDEALPRCLDALGQGLGARVALLWRPDASNRELRCAAAWQAEAGCGGEFVAASRALGLERRHGLPGRVWAAGETATAADMADPAGGGDRAAAAASDGLHGALAVPIASERDVHGVIELVRSEVGGFDEDIVALATSIGLPIGQYVERKRAERAVIENAENIAAVLEATRELARSASGNEARSAICDAALKVSGGVLAALFEPDPDGRGLVTSAARGEVPAMFRDAMLPFVGARSAEVQAFTAGERLFVDDTVDHPLVARELEERGVRSCLYQPVQRDGRSVGVLMVAWGRSAARLSGRLADVLALLAAEAAVAIERADLLARLEAIARTDDLTGLANRRAWDELLPTELARARRDGEPLCVAMLDLDRFKAYNDEHGHQTGDRLLKAAAGAWRRQLRATDVLARYGGEEFALVLPRCDLEDALVLLARLRSETPEEQTASAGVAVWNGEEAPESLVARADEALYEAKDGGRNQVRVHSHDGLVA
jgi:diguanylate cyclase (GGDEF)-like protein